MSQFPGASGGMGIASAGAVGIDIIATVRLDPSSVQNAAQQARGAIQAGAQGIPISGGGPGYFPASGPFNGVAGGGAFTGPAGFAAGGISGTVFGGTPFGFGASGSAVHNGFSLQGTAAGGMGVSLGNTSQGDYRRAGQEYDVRMEMARARAGVVNQDAMDSYQEGIASRRAAGAQSDLHVELARARAGVVNQDAMDSYNEGISANRAAGGAFDMRAELAHARAAATTQNRWDQYQDVVTHFRDKGTAFDMRQELARAHAGAVNQDAMDLQEEGEAQVASRQKYYRDGAKAREEKGRGGFSIGKYIAGHVALASIGAGFRMMNISRDLSSDEAMAGEDSAGILRANVKSRQAELQTWSGIPFIGGMIGSIRDWKDSGSMSSVADQTQALEFSERQTKLADQRLATGKDVRRYREQVVSSYDPLQRERTEMADTSRQRSEEFARQRTEAASIERSRLLKEADTFARENPLGWVDSAIAYAQTGKTYSQRLQDGSLTRNQGSINAILDKVTPAETDAAKADQLHLADIRFRQWERKAELFGEYTAVSAGMYGNTFAEETARLNEKHRQAKDRSDQQLDIDRSPLSTATQAEKDQHKWEAAALAATAKVENTGLAYSQGIQRSDIAGEVASISMSQAAVGLRSQGKMYEALRKDAQTRQAIALNRVQALNPDDVGYAAANAETVAAGQNLRDVDAGISRDRTGRLNRITASDVSLRYQTDAAKSYSQRNFSAARTSSMLAGIEEQAILGEAAVAQETDPTIRKRMADNLTKNLELQSYKAAHHYDTGYAEQRDVYRTIKEGYTNPGSASFNSGDIVAAIGKLINQVAGLAGGTSQPLLVPG